MLDACEKKDGEGVRNHSRAMTIEDMRKMRLYTEQRLQDRTVQADLKEMTTLLMDAALRDTGHTCMARSD